MGAVTEIGSIAEDEQCALIETPAWFDRETGSADSGELLGAVAAQGAGATDEDAAIEKDLVQMVREKIGPIACYKTTAVVPRLPKTRSGKILRGTMRAIANGKEYRMPSTIDDPTTLDEITETFNHLRVAK